MGAFKLSSQVQWLLELLLEIHYAHAFLPRFLLQCRYHLLLQKPHHYISDQKWRKNKIQS